MISLRDIREGSVVMVRPAFGMDDPIEATIAEIHENIKNNFPGIVYGMHWAYLDQIDSVVTY